MNKTKVVFIFSFVSFFIFMSLWKEMFAPTKNATSFPDLAHLLTLISLAPVILLTPTQEYLVKKTLIIALCIPAFIIAFSNITNDQFFAKTVVELAWATLLYTIPISILLGVLRFIISVARKKQSSN